jgi:hypothetical protein
MFIRHTTISQKSYYCVKIQIVHFESSFLYKLVQAESRTFLNVIFERLVRIVTKICVQRHVGIITHFDHWA